MKKIEVKEGDNVFILAKFVRVDKNLVMLKIAGKSFLIPKEAVHRAYSLKEIFKDVD